MADVSDAGSRLQGHSSDVFVPKSSASIDGRSCVDAAAPSGDDDSLPILSRQEFFEARRSLPRKVDVLLCLERRPSELLIGWSIPRRKRSELPLPILDYELQYSKDSYFSSWASVPKECFLSPTQKEDDIGLTRVRLSGLSPATTYLFRARACNEVGWSTDYSDVFKYCTSSVAPPPTQLQVLHRRPFAVVVSFVVQDAEGAPVLGVSVDGFWSDSCKVKLDSCLSGGLGAAGATSSRGQVEISGLPSESDTTIVLRSINAVGFSESVSEALVCRPSSKPDPITSLRCVGRGVDFLELEWYAEDSEGAPVDQCRLDCASHSMLGAWVSRPATKMETLFAEAAQGLRTLQEAAAPQRSKWRCRAEGLKPETQYLIRARSHNEVGWSDEPPSCRFLTASCPRVPQNLSIVGVTSTSLTIEFELSVDPLQLRCVDAVAGVRLEVAGSLRWHEVDSERVVLGTLKPRIGRDDRAIVASAAYVESCEVQVLAGMVAVSGLSGHTTYELRLSVRNAVGWCEAPSDSIRCFTAPRPGPPSEIVAIGVGPCHSELSFRVADPPSAPVIGAKVEIRELGSMFFSHSWSDVSLETLHRIKPVSEGMWSLLVDGLKPSANYEIRVQALNASGFSQWSALIEYSGPRPPEVLSFDASFLAGTDGRQIKVTLILSSPECAPALVCLVSCGKMGCWLLGRGCEGVRGQASLVWVGIVPIDDRWIHPRGTDEPVVSVTVLAASAVGWGPRLMASHIVKQCDEASVSEITAAASTCTLLEGPYCLARWLADIVGDEWAVRDVLVNFVRELLAGAHQKREAKKLKLALQARLRQARAAMKVLAEVMAATTQRSGAANNGTNLETDDETFLVLDNAHEVEATSLETFEDLRRMGVKVTETLEHLRSLAATSRELVVLDRAHQVVLSVIRAMLDGMMVAADADSILDPLYESLRVLANAAGSSKVMSLAELSSRETKFRQRFRTQLTIGWARSFVIAMQLLAILDGHGDVLDACLGVPQAFAALLNLCRSVEAEMGELEAMKDALKRLVQGAEVSLSIYQLPGTAVISALTEIVGLGGAYHVGVEVYWLEWSFGYCDGLSASGVHAVRVGKSKNGMMKERIVLGCTPFAANEVMAILEKLRWEWPGSTYDMLHRNCGHFCLEFVKRLCVGQAPKRIAALSDAGAAVTKWLNPFSHIHVGSAAPASRSEGAVSRVDVEGLDEEASASVARAGDEEIDWCWRWAQNVVKQNILLAKRVEKRLEVLAEELQGTGRSFKQ